MNITQKESVEGIILLTDRIKFLEVALAEEQQRYQDATKIVPQLKKALDKANQFIYEVKKAMQSADESYQHSVVLFDRLSKTIGIDPMVQNIAYLHKMGKSLTQMADIILNDRSKKARMHRLLNKAKSEFPELFELAKNTEKPL